MPRQGHSESDAERQRRLDEEARDRANAQAREEQAIDEMVKKSIQLHGA